MANNYIDLLNEIREKRRSNDLNGALEITKKAMEMSPLAHDAYFQYGLINDDLKNFEESVSGYTKCIELFPDFSVADKGSPNALYYLKDFLSGAYYNRGLILYFELGKKEEGREDWKKAAELGHDNAEEALEKCP